MNAKEILKNLKEEPFDPFVIVTSAGERFEVRHPENVKLVAGGVVYVFFPSDDPEAQVESPTRISVHHITTLDPLRDTAA